MSDASDEACTNFNMSGCHARKPEPDEQLGFPIPVDPE
jgi:hypothetical protein